MSIHWKHVEKYKFLQWLLVDRGRVLPSMSMCQSTWFVKLASWLGRSEFWHFLNLNVASVCQKKLKIRSSWFTKMMNIRGWCLEQKIMLALQGMFINKSVCYPVTRSSYTSHTTRSFPNTRLGCQSFVNSDLSCALQSPHLVLIFHECVLSTKTQN